MNTKIIEKTSHLLLASIQCMVNNVTVVITHMTDSNFYYVNDLYHMTIPNRNCCLFLSKNNMSSNREELSNYFNNIDDIEIVNQAVYELLQEF